MLNTEVPADTRICSRVRLAAFGGEVSVLNRALGRGEIGYGVGQGVDVGIDARCLEGAETAAEFAHLVRGRGDDLARRAWHCCSARRCLPEPNS